MERRNRDSVAARHDEKHYSIDENRRGSKVLDFASDRFDALHCLAAEERAVAEANPTIFSTIPTKMDDVSKFRPLLPECDPLRSEPSSRVGPPDSHKGNRSDEGKKLPMFLAMASRYERSGPLSLLYSILARRQRVRVMVRYVDCIRGTLTGYLVAFDHHFNMILRDADEAYVGRITRNADAVQAAGGGGPRAADAPSKPALEARRRRGGGAAAKLRHFHRLLVRGDNVVMAWRAEAERSPRPSLSRERDPGSRT